MLPAAAELGVSPIASARSRTSSSPDSPPTGSAPRRTIFIPAYSFGIVRGGDLDAALQPELADGEVHHLGADQPQIEHVGSRLGGAPHHRRGHLRAREAHVAADRDPPRLELLDVGAPDRVGAGLVEIVWIDAADVVCLEDLRVEHRGDAMETARSAVTVGAAPATTIQWWNGSSRPSCSSTSSPRRSSSRAWTRRSSAAASRSSSSRSRTASSRTAASSRSSPATP